MAGSANNDKKVFDVAKPGKTPPASTARPIIVGHRAMVQDPMMSSASAPEDSPEPKNSSAPLAGRGKTLIPVSEQEEDKPAEAPKPKEKAAAKEEPTPPADKTPKPEEPPAEAPKEQESQPAEPPASVAPLDEAAQEDQEATSAALKKKEEEEKALAEAERIDKLAASKKYALPIREASGRSLKRTALVGLVCFVVGAAGLYLAADAKLLGDITVPVDLIKTDSMSSATAPASSPPAATPAAAKTTYTSTAHGVSFQYPASWKQTADSSGKEAVSVQSNAPLGAQEGGFFVGFIPGPGINTSIPHVVRSITYTDIKVSATKTLYLREAIISPDMGAIVPSATNKEATFSLVMSVADQKYGERPGGPTDRLQSSFAAPDGSTRLLFGAFITAGDRDKQRFTTQEKATQYTKTARYKAAREILLSTKFTK